MLSNNPLFIAIDGIDGCGKSTQAKMLAQYFSDIGLNVFLTKEPGGTEVGNILRNILISQKYHLDSISEMLLYSADRLEHQKQIIIPKLGENTNVITDRFLSSTYAYQIFGRKLEKNILDELVKLTVKIFPHYTFILDIKPEVAIERAKNRLIQHGKMEEEGKFESLKISFFEDVRDGFLWYANNFPGCHIIDADNTVEEIHKSIKNIIKI
ncbi:MAG: thymidylate kinase [Deferribacteraceae bacterium]|nr:thymidylate kinase [Deferribacteraceae bacterium]